MSSINTRIATTSDFEDISLGDLKALRPSNGKHSRPPSFRDSILSMSGESSIDEHQLSYPSMFSNLSTPTLSSDTSSVRSGSIASSPRTPPSGSSVMKNLSPSTPDLHVGKTRSKMLGRQNSLIDTTSMASLTIRSQARTRSRKQRERDLELDNDDDIWPQDEVMFNVPMSPALFQQQKQKIMLQRQNSQNRPPVYSRRSITAFPPQFADRPRNMPNMIPNMGYRRHDSLPNVRATRQRQPSMPNINAQQNLPENCDQEFDINQDTLSVLGSDALDLTMDLCRHAEMVKNRQVDNKAEPKASAPIEESTATSSSDENQNQNDNQAPLPLPLPPTPSDDENSSRRASLTRPENLPPMDPEEERKHLKTYEKMLRESAVAEKRRIQKQEQKMKKRAALANADSQVWSAWLSKKGKSKLHNDLKWRGIPTRLRGQVWMFQTGANTKDLPEVSNVYRDEIMRDSELMWPECGIFGAGRPLNEALLRVTQRVLTLFPGVKYQAAFTGLAALLLLHLDEEESVAVMRELLKPGSLPHAVLTGNEQFASAMYVSFQNIFQVKFAHLCSHFEKNGVSEIEILNPFMGGLFANILPTPEIAARIVDLYIFEGDQFLLRAALGIIRVNEAWLYVSKPEILEQLRHPRIVDDDDLINIIHDVTK